MTLSDPETNLNFETSSDFIEKKYLAEIQKFDGCLYGLEALGALRVENQVQNCKNRYVYTTYSDIAAIS